MNRPGKFKAAAVSAGLSLLFLVVYGGCNWLTARRSDVGTWYYEWERHIPFVPWLIIPYMSIDLFFVAAPFLCRSNKELATFARRITLAIAIAGLCFLVMPLTLAVPRPQTEDWTAPIFRFLHGFDQPFNLFPSLHITLRTILAVHYARHVRGALKLASHVWFSLIGVSTLLTYQHHVADIVGGFILAAVCFYAFAETPFRLPVIPNQRVGLYYLLGAIACAATGFIAWPLTALLWWPAIAMGITAGAYWGLGPGIYRKANGQLPLCSRLMFLPCLLGQHLSLLYYRRQCAKWNQVAPGVLLGIRLNEKEAEQAIKAGVTAVLDLTAEFSEARPLSSLTYCNLPVLDLSELTPEHLNTAARFIADHSRSGVVYVHCKVGYSRGGAAVGAFVLASGLAWDVNDCLAQLRSTRPGIVLRPEVATALEGFRLALPSVQTSRALTRASYTELTSPRPPATSENGEALLRGRPR